MRVKRSSRFLCHPSRYISVPHSDDMLTTVSELGLEDQQCNCSQKSDCVSYRAIWCWQKYCLAVYRAIL